MVHLAMAETVRLRFNQRTIWLLIFQQVVVWWMIRQSDSKSKFHNQMVSMTNTRTNTSMVLMYKISIVSMTNSKTRINPLALLQIPSKKPAIMELIYKVLWIIQMEVKIRQVKDLLRIILHPLNHLQICFQREVAT